jgi:hypothetical protein
MQSLLFTSAYMHSAAYVRRANSPIYADIEGGSSRRIDAFLAGQRHQLYSVAAADFDNLLLQELITEQRSG